MHFHKYLVLAALPATFHHALAQKVVDLTGDGWTVSSKALNISVPGKLPSQVHLDLLAAKTIGKILRSTLPLFKYTVADVWQMIR
jgi:beta-mannosidase